jgi:hypothetical protein
VALVLDLKLDSVWVRLCEISGPILRVYRETVRGDRGAPGIEPVDCNQAKFRRWVEEAKALAAWMPARGGKDGRER